MSVSCMTDENSASHVCHNYYLPCETVMLLIYWLLIILCFSLILDNERWKQADVPAEFQDLVSHIGNNGWC